MSDFTYQFPEQSAFVYTLRMFLETSDEEEISALLTGAQCAFSSYGQFSHVRWNSYTATITFRVSVEVLNRFTDEVKKKLLDFANRIMPPEAGYELKHIDVVPDLLTPPSMDTLASVSVELASLKHRFNPIFGQPTVAKLFMCDIFMIMPFAPEFDPVYESIVVPTVKELGLSIKRGDDPFSKHEIMHDIWSMLNACRLVVADCTGRNPNVFYELGIAHTIGKPVVMLTQNLAELPFDVQNRRAIEYNIAFHKIDSLKQKLNAAIRSILPSSVDGIPL
jgi:hypothetical protein